jgi:flavin-dependent dehydrogenase
MDQRNFDTDVFVVGGGPAGLAAAIAARQHGFSVMVADSAVPPVDKACGEGLMPDAQAALRRLGLRIQGCEQGRFEGIKFIGPEGAVVARFGQGEGIGIRRTVLHQTLHQFATSLGVETLWGARVAKSASDRKFITERGMAGARVCVGKEVITARWLIGADGQHSQVRNWAGLSWAFEGTQRIGIRQHFHVAPLSNFVEIYWGREGQAYVTPVGEEEISVVLISRKKFYSFDAGLVQFPVLARHLQGAEHTSSMRGAVTISRKLKSVFRGNTALIGEASGSVDAITGQGLGMAFRQAEALGCALMKEDLSLYQAEHRRIAGLPAFMGRSMLWMDKSAWIRRQALRVMVRTPALFERLLSIHAGEVSIGWLFRNGCPES